MKEMIKRDYKKWLMIAMKCIIFAICSGLMTTGIHMLNSKLITHVAGKPAFVTTTLILYGAAEKILFAIGYVILGHKIPIKNPILRAVAYMEIVWGSNYLPQFMGLAFADGPIAQQVFVISDLICDSIVYLLSGIVLGFLFINKKKVELSKCSNNKMIKAMVVSAILFPILVFIADQLMVIIYPPFSSIDAMQVSSEVKIPFYINFYSWFILAGALISLFYRLSDYDKGRNGWLQFALKYSILIWSPLVLIMIIFGTEIIATFVFDLLFVLCICILCCVNGKILFSNN